MRDEPIAARVVSTRADLEEVARSFAERQGVAVDVESDGMFAYRAQICAVQLAAGDEVCLVDALATPLSPLAALLGEGGPSKIVHDVAFDARMLADLGIRLGHVRDTAIAARMLGRPATGLAALAKAELGVAIDKELQHHDWRIRPLEEAHVEYLARDVVHLEALADVLWRELSARGIEEEVLEETRYRIRSALESADERAAGRGDPPYASAKGAERLAPVERAILRRLWEVREEEARRLDVPAARLLATEALVALARARPRSPADLAKARLPRERARPLVEPILEAVARGLDDQDVPEGERSLFQRPSPPREVIARRRARETALMAWRREEAKQRGVDEQVVLPGHCVKDLALASGMEVGTIKSVPGFGECRARYVEAIALSLQRASTGTEEG